MQALQAQDMSDFLIVTPQRPPTHQEQPLTRMKVELWDGPNALCTPGAASLPP